MQITESEIINADELFNASIFWNARMYICKNTLLLFNKYVESH